jgi:hypothetical protein
MQDIQFQPQNIKGHKSVHKGDAVLNCSSKQ